MKKGITESAVIVSYIHEVETMNGHTISEAQLTEFMRTLGLSRGLIDFEIMSLKERGLIKSVQTHEGPGYRLTRKGIKFSKKVIIVN